MRHRKLALVVGTRPEVIKMAPVLRACRRAKVAHVMIDTGQHYSFELNSLQFRDLDLPEPDHRLEVGSADRDTQLERIQTRLRPILGRERPDVVLVQGDTNSVLASALAARSLGIAVGHIEAGLRSHDQSMPEELNRTLTDHASDYLFAPTDLARETLVGEGIAPHQVFVTGNTVVDELLRNRPRAAPPELFARYRVRPGEYALATVHRDENVRDENRLRRIFQGLADVGRKLDLPILVPLHPRTRSRLEDLSITCATPIRVLPPLGYHEFLGLHASAELMLTDSGGLQEEACTLRVPCVTLRDNTERPEALRVGASLLAGTDPGRILDCAVLMRGRDRNWPNPFGDGQSGRRIVELLVG